MSESKAKAICSACNGTGLIIDYTLFIICFWLPFDTTCHTCEGKGWL